eukprot:CAMPEP_0198134158 /NCGR_PEP_ID=MMETSP1442-20131203/59936_1 /TAXON_ID= /ORGANISM="Craspedostauros australis, Strain CCMP3328" /LENGTH=158 /DNA_ID=CAMNT_0043795299 /DNA_START=640 /DNA_END=1116 /DNA_ORIENTATION=+
MAARSAQASSAWASPRANGQIPAVGSSWLGPQWSIVANNVAIRTFASKKHKNLLKHSKGFRGRAKNCYSIAVRAVHKSWQHAYRGRKLKKREYHKLWIQRINAGVKQYSWNYSTFIGSLRKSDLKLDRKVLADLAATEPFAFKSVVQVIGQTTKRAAP